jgi:hypothetical protein
MTQQGSVPDISLELSHLRALLSAASLQTTHKPTTAEDVEIVSWLVFDAIKELSTIEQIYYEEPDTTQ